jgi:predicted membrane channel-forming protein YqfA (hemolysin III family)
LQLNTANVHTPTMTLKNAALLALVGTILMTALLVWNFVFTLLSVLRDLVPAVALFSSLIYTFGCFTVMLFFFVFHRAQP